MTHVPTIQRELRPRRGRRASMILPGALLLVPCTLARAGSTQACFADATLARIASTADGGFVAVGSLPVPGMYSEAFVARWDAAGSLVAQSRIGTAAASESGSDVVQAPDGGFYVLVDRPPSGLSVVKLTPA